MIIILFNLDYIMTESNQNNYIDNSIDNNIYDCGVVETYYDDAKTKLKEKYFIMNGKREGKYEFFDYNTANILLEEYYINNMKEGISKYYDNKNNVFLETNYINNKKHGIETEYYNNGIIKSTTEYDYTKYGKDGRQKEYDNNGNLIKETTWLLDRRHSECKIYVDNKLSEIYTYMSGTYEGPYKKFHPNGKIAIEGKYNHHRKIGIFRHYNVNGDLILEEEYDYLTGSKKEKK